MLRPGDVAAWRKRLGMTAAELGRRAGVTGSYVGAIESGRAQNVGASVLLRIERALRDAEAPAADAPADTAPDPGVAELLADEERCRALRITPRERAALLALREGIVADAIQAEAVLRALRL